MTYFRLCLSIIIVIYPIFAQSLYSQTDNSNYNEQNVNSNDDNKQYSSSQTQRYNAFGKKYCYTFFSIALLGFPNSDLEIPSRDYDVMGARLNILFGDHKNLYGFDLGICNYLSESLYGAQFGLLNITRESIFKDSYGLQMGFLNVSSYNFTGFQTGVFSYSKNVKGLQIGLFNGAEMISGLQIGLVNETRIMYGIQIGFINTIHTNNRPIIPIINAQF